MHKNKLYRFLVKRLLDFLISFIGIIVLLPVFIVVAILVKLKLGSPIIFKQKRIGYKEKEFYIYKFRSMKNSKDSKGELLPDDKRLTKFGRLLRSTSLDELPEFFNILKGDMSIVGPRPLVTQYLPYFKDEERTRHSVRPGLTGLAQVNGRNAIFWEERFMYDIQYVQQMSLLKDIKILIKTFYIVFKKENIGERNQNASIDFNQYRINQRREKNESQG